MNKDRLNALLKFYKARYYDIQEQELYKWEAVRHFKEVWDIEVADFPDMLESALSKNGNLSVSGKYNPRKGIIMGARKDEKCIRQLFDNLYDENEDIGKRISDFKDSSKKILQTCEEYKDLNKQDVRAIVLYLTLHYPERYYLYKYDMFKNYAEFVEYNPSLSENSLSEDIQRVLKFFKICDELQQIVVKDAELMSLYKDRKIKYGDTECHMLVQDIIYSLYYYQEPEKLKKEEKSHLEKALDEKHSYEEREEHARQIDLKSLVKIVKMQMKNVPKTMEISVQRVIRNPYIAEYAKRRANGICQLCMNPAPFKKSNGDSYLESHHIVWLSEGGDDSIDNTVALCPNCHRRMHIVNELEDVQKLKRLVGN